MSFKFWILDRNENIKAVASNRGAAIPIFEFVEHEQLNGEFNVAFKVPANHDDAQYIAEGSSILAPDTDGNYQQYKIIETRAIFGEENVIEVVADHISCELADVIIEKYEAENATASEMLFRILSGTRWEPGIVEVGGTASLTFYMRNALQCIHDIVASLGGELRFRVEFNGNRIVKRYIDILARRGRDTGKRFEYGKDIVNIVRTVDESAVATALIGLGKATETQLANGENERITFADIEWSKANGAPENKPKGQIWIGDENARQNFGIPDGKGGRAHRFRVIEFSDIEDPEELLQKTYEVLPEYTQPRITYDANVIDLETALGYPHEAVRLGDTVAVINRDFTPELRVKARVVEIYRDRLQPDNSRVILGNFIDLFSDRDELDRIIDRSRSWDGALKPGDAINTSWLSGAIDTLQNEILAGGGKYRITDGGVLSLDRPPDQNPSKAIWQGGDIIAVSNERKPGEDPATPAGWNFRNAITGDGIVADAITTGSMLADRVRGGELYLGGEVEGIGKDGKLYLLDSENNTVAQLDAATRGFDQLTIGQLTCPNVPQILLEDVDFYVDIVDGNDENDGLSPETAFRTIQRAIDSCPKILYAYCRIHILDKGVAEWDEFLYIQSFMGHGNLEIYFPQSGNMRLNGAILVEDCYTRIKVYDAIINYRDIPEAPESQRAVLWALNSQMIEMYRCKMFGISSIPYVVQASNAYVHLEDCETWDAGTACIIAQRGARLDIVNVKGGNAPYGLWSSRASIIGGHADGLPAPKGTTANTRSTGGGIVWNGFDYSWSGGTTPPPKSTSQTKQWKSIAAGSYEPTYGWRTNAVYQGDPGSWAPSIGNYRGIWIFDAAAIRSALAGKTIKSIRIKLTRQAKGGYYSSRPVFFHTHNKTSPSGAAPTLSNSAGNLASFKPGESKWVNLPKSFASALQNGSATGIAIYDSSGSQSNYLIMEKSATLEITYQ